MALSEESSDRTSVTAQFAAKEAAATFAPGGEQSDATSRLRDPLTSAVAPPMFAPSSYDFDDLHELDRASQEDVTRWLANSTLEVAGEMPIARPADWEPERGHGAGGAAWTGAVGSGSGSSPWMRGSHGRQVDRDESDTAAAPSEAAVQRNRRAMSLLPLPGDAWLDPARGLSQEAGGATAPPPESRRLDMSRLTNPESGGDTVRMPPRTTAGGLREDAFEPNGSALRSDGTGWVTFPAEMLA